MAFARGDQVFRQRLEQLHDIEFAAAQSRDILAHRPVLDAVERLGIDPDPPQVVLQAQPRRRHLADRREPMPDQYRQPEIGPRRAADQHKGIAGHAFGDTDEIAMRPLVVDRLTRIGPPR